MPEAARGRAMFKFWRGRELSKRRERLRLEAILGL